MNSPQWLNIYVGFPGAFVLVNVSGKLDVAGPPQLRDELAQVMKVENCSVAVDIAEVEYMDSSGLEVLVSANIRALTHGQDFVVLYPSPQALCLFEITGLGDVVSIVGAGVTPGRNISIKSLGAYEEQPQRLHASR